MRARVALFRAREDASASAARLRRLGFSVVCLPVIEIKARAVRPRQARYDAIVATSDKAFLCEALCVRPSPLYVVGARTGREAEAHGWRLASPPAPAAAELIDTLRRSLRPGASVLYLAGRDRKGAVETALGEELRWRSSKPTRPRRARAGARRRRGLSPPASRRCIIRDDQPRLRRNWPRSPARRSAFSRSATSVSRSDVAEPLEALGAAPITIAETPDEPALFRALSRNFGEFPSLGASRI